MKISEFFWESKIAEMISDAFWYMIIVNFCLLLIVLGQLDYRDLNGDL
jgi:hypothetical protein